MKRVAAVLLAFTAFTAQAVPPEESRLGVQYAVHSIEDNPEPGQPFQPDWTEYTLIGAKRFHGGRSLVLEVMRAERFGISDTQGVLTYRKDYDEGWSIELEGGGASPNEILPAWLGALRVERHVGFATFGAGWKRSHYRDADVNLWTGAIDLEGRHAYAGYTAYHGELLGGGSGLAHAVELGVLYGERSRLGVGYVTGDEANRVTADQVVVTDITTRIITGQHWLGETWGILYGAEWHEQGVLYTREGVRIGLVHRF